MTGFDLRLAAAGPAVRAGLRWWGRGLEEALPGWLVALAAGDRRWVSVALDEDDRLTARLMASPGATAPLATARLAETADASAPPRPLRAAARSRHVVLQAPDARVLTQTVRAPAAALENLAEAVRFGLPTWTPFAAEDVIFHAKVVERGEDHARIEIRMIPRAALAPLVERAARAGLDVSAVAFGRDVVPYGDRGEAVARRIARAGRVDLALAASAVALAVGMLAALHLGWARELDGLQEDIKAEVAHRAKQTKLESELAQIEARRRAVLQKRASEPRVSEVVVDLAAHLPDSAETVEFEWAGRQGRVRVSAPPETDVGAALDASSVIVAKRESDDRDGVRLFGLTARTAR